MSVTLPKAFEIDQRHLRNLCSRAQLATEHCAGRRPIGTVKTQTPLLEGPLEGPAYAVSGFGVLPHVAFILAGQVTIIPEGESSTLKNGRLRTKVPTVPDAPIGHFQLTLFGGNQGYLINTRSLRSSASKVRVEYSAQNGVDQSKSVGLKTACPKKAKHPKRRAASR